jgi:2-oxoglutarate dehydrogenase complex dehydrogenase (E1) component-like enzyme
MQSKIMWVQEEHMNQGGYHYVRDRIAFALKIPIEEVKYGGRSSSASSATGSKIIFDNEKQNLLATAMDLN